MENATVQLQLAVVTPIDELKNRKIESNADALLPVIKERTAEYKSTVYGITQEKMCREHRATLNKFLTAINDEVKAIGAANNQPFVEFQAQVKPIIDEVTDAIKSLDAQLEEMEGLWRSNNLENAKLLYDHIIGEGQFASWIPYEKILITKKTGRTSYEDFFGNKTTWNYAEGHEDAKDIDVLMKAGKKVAEVFETLNRLAQEKLDVINDLDYSEEIKKRGILFLQASYDPVKRGFNVEGAFSLMSDLARKEREKAEAVAAAQRQAELDKQRAILEAQQKAEAEKQRALEEERKKAEAEKQKSILEAQQKAKAEEQRRLYEQQLAQKKLAEAEKKDNVPWEQNQTATQTQPQDLTSQLFDEHPKEEKRYKVRFETDLTQAQITALATFCKANNIVLKRL